MVLCWMWLIIIVFFQLPAKERYLIHFHFSKLKWFTLFDLCQIQWQCEQGPYTPPIHSNLYIYVGYTYPFQ